MLPKLPVSTPQRILNSRTGATLEEIKEAAMSGAIEVAGRNRRQ